MKVEMNCQEEVPSRYVIFTGTFVLGVVMRPSPSSYVAMWDKWAETADRADDGWQTDFPLWREMVFSIVLHMKRCRPDESQEFEAVAKVWSLAEEDTDLLGDVRDQPDDFREWVRALAKVASPIVRWQAYEVLGQWGDIDTLLAALPGESDRYARMRAIMSIGYGAPWLIMRDIDDPDAYIRLSVISAATDWIEPFLVKAIGDRSALVKRGVGKFIDVLVADRARRSNEEPEPM